MGRVSDFDPDPTTGSILGSFVSTKIHEKKQYRELGQSLLHATVNLGRKPTRAQFLRVWSFKVTLRTRILQIYSFRS